MDESRSRAFETSIFYCVFPLTSAISSGRRVWQTALQYLQACLNRHLEPPADEEMMIWFEGEMDEGPVQRLGDYRPAGVGHLSWGSTRSHILCD